jgi:hypothetical protein
MSKLKAFLIALDQVRKEKGQIIKYLGTGFDADYYGQLKVNDFVTNSKYWQAMQLVVCDVELEAGDYDTLFDYRSNCILQNMQVSHIQSSNSHRIIASHPTLPNTAPLSKEFVREYVACQGECLVKQSEDLNDYPLTDWNKNPILRIVPRTTVIDEETGSEIWHTEWSDADMQAAWNAKEQLYKVTDTPDFHTWLQDRKKDNK